MARCGEEPRWSARNRRATRSSPAVDDSLPGNALSGQEALRAEGAKRRAEQRKQRSKQASRPFTRIETLHDKWLARCRRRHRHCRPVARPKEPMLRAPEAPSRGSQVLHPRPAHREGRRPSCGGALLSRSSSFTKVPSILLVSAPNPPTPPFATTASGASENSPGGEASNPGHTVLPVPPERLPCGEPCGAMVTPPWSPGPIGTVPQSGSGTCSGTGTGTALAAHPRVPDRGIWRALAREALVPSATLPDWQYLSHCDDHIWASGPSRIPSFWISQQLRCRGIPTDGSTPSRVLKPLRRVPSREFCRLHVTARRLVA